MKTKLFTIISAIAGVASISSIAYGQSSNGIPTGTLTSGTGQVKAGEFATNLNWSISYPSIVKEYVTVAPTGITPKENLICDVRVLGAGVTSQSNGVITYYRTKGQMQFNGSSTWSVIFDGYNTDAIVKQQGIIKTYNVTANKPMTFSGQYYNSSWKTLYTSTSGDNIRFLVNGELCPGNIPDYNAPSLESFLKPYLDSAKRVKIGPMDVIIIMELTHTDKTNVGYDLQDLVLLATFRKS